MFFKPSHWPIVVLSYCCLLFSFALSPARAEPNCSSEELRINCEDYPVGFTCCRAENTTLQRMTTQNFDRMGRFLQEICTQSSNSDGRPTNHELGIAWFGNEAPLNCAKPLATAQNCSVLSDEEFKGSLDRLNNPEMYFHHFQAGYQFLRIRPGTKRTVRDSELSERDFHISVPNRAGQTLAPPPGIFGTVIRAIINANTNRRVLVDSHTASPPSHIPPRQRYYHSDIPSLKMILNSLSMEEKGFINSYVVLVEQYDRALREMLTLMQTKVSNAQKVQAWRRMNQRRVFMLNQTTGAIRTSQNLALAFTTGLSSDFEDYDDEYFDRYFIIDEFCEPKVVFVPTNKTRALQLMQAIVVSRGARHIGDEYFSGFERIRTIRPPFTAAESMVHWSTYYRYNIFYAVSGHRPGGRITARSGADATGDEQLLVPHNLFRVAGWRLLVALGIEYTIRLSAYPVSNFLYRNLPREFHPYVPVIMFAYGVAAGKLAGGVANRVGATNFKGIGGRLVRPFRPASLSTRPAATGTQPATPPGANNDPMILTFRRPSPPPTTTSQPLRPTGTDPHPLPASPNPAPSAGPQAVPTPANPVIAGRIEPVGPAPAPVAPPAAAGAPAAPGNVANAAAATYFSSRVLISTPPPAPTHFDSVRRPHPDPFLPIAWGSMDERQWSNFLNRFYQHEDQALSDDDEFTQILSNLCLSNPPETSIFVMQKENGELIVLPMHREIHNALPSRLSLMASINRFNGVPEALRIPLRLKARGKLRLLYTMTRVTPRPRPDQTDSVWARRFGNPSSLGFNEEHPDALHAGHSAGGQWGWKAIGFNVYPAQDVALSSPKSAARFARPGEQACSAIRRRNGMENCVSRFAAVNPSKILCEYVTYNYNPQDTHLQPNYLYYGFLATEDNGNRRRRTTINQMIGFDNLKPFVGAQP